MQAPFNTPFLSMQPPLQPMPMLGGMPPSAPMLMYDFRTQTFWLSTLSLSCRPASLDIYHAFSQQQFTFAQQQQQMNLYHMLSRTAQPYQPYQQFSALPPAQQRPGS
jgi:hypothetical protein